MTLSDDKKAKEEENGEAKVAGDSGTLELENAQCSPEKGDISRFSEENNDKIDEENAKEWPPVPVVVGGGSNGEEPGDEDDLSGPISNIAEGDLAEQSQDTTNKVSIFSGDPEQEAALKQAHHEVLEASRIGDLDALKALLQEDPSVLEFEDFGGCTPLILCCMRRHRTCVEFLILQGADVFKVDKTGRKGFDYIINPHERHDLERLYHESTPEGKAELAQKARAEADIDAAMEAIHAPAIMDAAFRGDVEELKRQFDINPDMVNVRDKMGNTALIAAAATNQIVAAHYLLERGADIRDVTDRVHPVGYDALSFARGPAAREDLRFLAESATIEYKAREHAKSLFTIAYDHAKCRMEIEDWRRQEAQAAKERAEYLAMVARTQRALSMDVTEATVLTSTDTAFIKFMVDEEKRLNEITERLEQDAVLLHQSTGDARVMYVRKKFDSEKRLVTVGKARRDAEALLEAQAMASANASVSSVIHRKRVEEHKATQMAERRVMEQYAAHVDILKARAIERDRRLKPRKTELTARMSKSAKQLM